MLAALAATGILAASAVIMDLRGDADDLEGPRALAREHPAPGTRLERLKRALTVEFRPHEEHRIAVGDEVWVDLDPVFHGMSVQPGDGSSSAAVRKVAGRPGHGMPRPLNNTRRCGNPHD
jgi:hypothetical protein